MNNGKYVFSQFVEYLPQRIFYEISQSYEGDKYSKYFTYQLLFTNVFQFFVILDIESLLFPALK